MLWRHQPPVALVLVRSTRTSHLSRHWEMRTYTKQDLIHLLLLHELHRHCNTTRWTVTLGRERHWHTPNPKPPEALMPVLELPAKWQLQTETDTVTLHQHLGRLRGQLRPATHHIHGLIRCPTVHHALCNLLDLPSDWDLQKPQGPFFSLQDPHRHICLQSWQEAHTVRTVLQQRNIPCQIEVPVLDMPSVALSFTPLEHLSKQAKKTPSRFHTPLPTGIPSIV